MNQIHTTIHTDIHNDRAPRPSADLNTLRTKHA